MLRMISLSSLFSRITWLRISFSSWTSFSMFLFMAHLEASDSIIENQQGTCQYQREKHRSEN